MRFINLKKIALASLLGVVTLLGTSEIANAQSSRAIERQERRLEKQREKLYRQQQRVQTMRYRIYRNGNYYYTDNRGIELLRQAVNRGYQEGFRAGQNDRRYGRGSSYYDSYVYRNSNYGYQNYVDYNQYQYYFQQGFQRGYADGYNSTYRYGTYRNGAANILGSILSAILNPQRY